MTGTVLGVGPRRPVRRLAWWLGTFLGVYYTLLVLLVGPAPSPAQPPSSTPLRYSAFSLLIAPAALALLSFASACLAKILLDIARSNRSSIHEQSYHELIADIQMAKDDLRNKGISVD